MSGAVSGLFTDRIGVRRPSMTRGPTNAYRLCVLALSVLIRSSAGADRDNAPQLYEIITETAMPHLEENLRYATTREQRCLGQGELRSAFAILQYAALEGLQIGRGEAPGGRSLVRTGLQRRTGNDRACHLAARARAEHRDAQRQTGR